MDYSFSYDEHRNLLTITQSGYWSLGIFDRFRQEFLALHSKILTCHPSYRVFAQCTDYPVQSHEVGEAFSVFFATLMHENKGRYAILVGSALNKMQAQRVLPQPHVKTFINGDTAMAWLMA